MYIFIDEEYTVLEKPLIRTEVIRRMDQDGYISGVVAVDLSELIDCDHESLMDLFSHRLIGTACLSNITFNIVGCCDFDKVLIKVEGHADEYEEESGEIEGIALPEEFKFENTQNVFSAGIIYQAKRANGYGDYHVFWGMNTNGTETNKSVSDYWYTEKEVMNYVYNGWWIIK